ncbi:hypothetical protein T08_4539 [Trichinella sp. T8]|nr:hypothetical protein T08_4539 [Trichinella sp. T8]
MSFRYYHCTCECRPRGYLVNQCLEQQSRSALSSFSQYRLQLGARYTRPAPPPPSFEESLLYIVLVQPHLHKALFYTSLIYAIILFVIDRDFHL